MDILTDTIVWLIEKVAQLGLTFGRWASQTVIWALDWTSEKAVNGLRLMANLAQWGLDNPWKALQNLAIVVAVVVLVLIIEIYFYDLMKRRQAAYHAYLAQRSQAGD